MADVWARKGGAAEALCHARGFIEIGRVGEYCDAAGVFRYDLDRRFGQGSGERHGHCAKTHRAEQHENPLRDVFHENADAIARFRAFLLKKRCDLVRVGEDIGVTIFFDPVLLIDRKREAVRETAIPFFDALEDPAWRRRLNDRRSRSLCEETHTG